MSSVYHPACSTETIWRWGKKIEVLENIQALCQDAHDVIGLYGVTAFAGKPPYEVVVSYANVADLLEQGFMVYITPLDSTPEHRTVVFPKPITPEVMERWNEIWGKQE